jgi:hypothetical protein
VLVVQSRSEGTAERGAAARRLAPALIVPVLLLLPYLIAIALGQHPVAATGQPPFLRALSSLALAGALVVPAALVWLRHRRGAAERVLWTACWALAVGALALRVPGNNQTKVLNLLFFVASAPAAMGWIAWLRRRAPRVRALAIAALGLATIPTLALCAWAYAHERNQGAHDYREPRGDDAAAYAWVARATPASALLVDTADEASGGTTASVSARRTMLWGGEWNARLIGYAPEALAVRRTTAQDLAGGWPLQPASIALLGNLGREVYVIEHRAPGRRPLDASAAYRRVFTSGTVSVLRWEAPR